MTAGVVERGGPARWWLPTGFVVLFVTVGLLGTRPHPDRHGPPPR